MRIGLFALKNGKLRDGKQVLPNKWIKESIKPSKAMRYYGYQWWLDGPPFKSYRAIGIFGQLIWIDPQTQTVIAIVVSLPKRLPKRRVHKLIILLKKMATLY